MEYFFQFKNTKTAEIATYRAKTRIEAVNLLIQEKQDPMDYRFEAKKTIHPEMGNR